MVGHSAPGSGCTSSSRRRGWITKSGRPLAPARTPCPGEWPGPLDVVGGPTRHHFVHREAQVPRLGETVDPEAAKWVARCPRLCGTPKPSAERSCRRLVLPPHQVFVHPKCPKQAGAEGEWGPKGPPHHANSINRFSEHTNPDKINRVDGFENKRRCSKALEMQTSPPENTPAPKPHSPCACRENPTGNHTSGQHAAAEGGCSLNPLEPQREASQSSPQQCGYPLCNKGTPA